MPAQPIGSDDCLYYMITDCKGNVVKALTQVPNSHGASSNGYSLDGTGKSDAMMFFIDGKVNISYNNFTALYTYDTNSEAEGIVNLTENSALVRTSNFHDGWAECEIVISNTLSLSNYVTENNEFLFEYGFEMDDEFIDKYIGYANSGIYFMDDSKILS